MTSCAVPGCNSDSNAATDCTFHRLPSSLIPRSRWILALGPLPSGSYVCSRHFEASMFTKRGNTKTLKPDAVPEPCSWPNDELCPNLNEGSGSDEVESGGELAACRACLAADGRLVPLRGSGWERSLAALTGVALSTEKSFPRHLCVFCLAKLSKCAAFRDSCQRSAALLRTLLERGPLKINEIKAIKRNSKQLTNNLTWNKLFQFGTGPLLTTPPEIKTEDEENSHKLTALIHIECLESEDLVKNDTNDADLDFEVPIEKRETPEIKKVKLKAESPRYKKVYVKTEHANANSGIDDDEESKLENDTGDFDTDTSEETLAALKKAKRKRVKSEKDTAKCPRKHKTGKTNTDAIPNDADDASKKPIRTRKRRGLKCADDNADFDRKYDCKTKVLSKEEQRQEVQERKRTSKSAFTCEVCGKGYKKESTLMTHKTYHDSKSLPAECDVCLLRFRSRRSLLKHMDCHRATFTCNQCGNVSRNRSHAKDHSLMHKGTTYTCPYCHIVYNHQTSYYNHIRMQHPGQNEPCDVCGETFAAGRGIMLHKALAHKQLDKTSVDTKCTVCCVTFSSEAALRRHEKLSVGASHASLWPCAACGDSCASDAARDAHTAHAHPPASLHYCKECDKNFSNAASFALHVDRKHNNRRAAEAPFRPRPGIGRVRSAVCEICGKVYPNITMLQYHMNGHLAVKPFQCPHCPKAFTHQSNHRLHMRVHTGERPYQCEQCPLSFSRRGNFTKHMKNVHLRLQVKCDACGKTVGAASLTSHVRAVHLRQPYVRRKRGRTDKKLHGAES